MPNYELYSGLGEVNSEPKKRSAKFSTMECYDEWLSRFAPGSEIEVRW